MGNIQDNVRVQGKPSQERGAIARSRRRAAFRGCLSTSTTVARDSDVLSAILNSATFKRAKNPNRRL